MTPDVRRRVLRLAWQVPAAAAIWLSLIQWPAAVTAELDPSWNLALSDAWLQGRQFGRDIIFTFGPLGFLLGPYVLPVEIPLKVAVGLVFKLFVALTLIEVATSLDIVRRMLLVTGIVCFGLLFPDATFTFVMLAVVVRWLLTPDSPAGRTTIGVSGLAFLSLVKFTNLVVAVAGVAAAVASHVAAGRARRAAALGAGFCASFLFLWTIAGQEMGSLLPFVRFGAEMAGGYAQAMAADESWEIFRNGVVIMFVFAGWIGAWTWPRRRSPEALAAAAIVSAGTFLAWKHGFTRADGHVLIFFGYALFLATGMPALLRGARSPWPLAIVLVAALNGLWTAAPEAVRLSPAWARGRIVLGVNQLTDWSWREALAAQTEANRSLWRFPETAAIVGDQPIDLIDFGQGIVLLNQLNYHPRPVPQSYAAYTPTLLRKNLDFIESDGAPRYLLMGWLAVDGRYLGQTDSLVLAELPRRYQPILQERQHVLLERRAVQPPPASQVLTPLMSVTVRSGETVVLPDEPGHALWMQVDVSLSSRGRLRGLFYKPPLLYMTAENESAHATSRLVPGIARAGFVLQPFLFDETDLMAFLRGTGVRRARRVRIDAAAGEEGYWGRFDVRISRMESLPLTPPM